MEAVHESGDGLAVPGPDQLDTSARGAEVPERGWLCRSQRGARRGRQREEAQIDMLPVIDDNGGVRGEAQRVNEEARDHEHSEEDELRRKSGGWRPPVFPGNFRRNDLPQ